VGSMAILGDEDMLKTKEATAACRSLNRLCRRKLSLFEVYD